MVEYIGIDIGGTNIRKRSKRMKNKNVIILGAARSGKSTLAKMIHNKYNYSIISIDSFVTAFRDCFRL